MFMAFSILNYDQVLMTTGSLTLHNKLLFYFIFAPLAREKKRAHAKKILHQTANFENHVRLKMCGAVNGQERVG